MVAPNGTLVTCRDCPRDALQLNLEAMGITSILPGAFDGLSSVNALLLNDNGISELPRDSLRGLDNLTYLSLSDNSFAALPDADAFGPTPLLQVLDLEFNILTALRPDGGCLSATPALETLLLGNNRICDLPPGSFAGLCKLSLLELNDNQLTRLNGSAFEGLQSLDTLDLVGNGLAALPPPSAGGFARSSLPLLRTLALARNALTAIPPGFFGGCAGLERVTLSDNAISCLGPDHLYPLASNVTGLYLDGNSIARILNGTFASLTAVQYISLVGNAMAAPQCNMNFASNVLPEACFSPPGTTC
jgi:Leucine-rich repeat (LRR) protein